MSLETETNVDEIDSVRDKDGNTVPAASTTGQGDYSGVYTEDKTVGTTAEALTSQAVPVGADVVVLAHPENGDRGFVGGANGDGVVIPLDAGQSANFAVDNMDAIQVKGDAAGVRFIAFVEVNA